MATEFLLSVECDTELFSNIAILVSHIIVDYIPFFKFALSDVTWHLEHECYTEMSRKSEVVRVYYCNQCS